MKTRILILSLLAGAGLSVSVASQAQLNLKQFGIGGNNSSSSGDSGAAGSSSGGVSQLLQSYVGANQQVLSGQSSLASAMGMSSDASKAQQATSLLSGGTPSVSQLTQMNSTQSSVSQRLQQAFTKGGASSQPVDKEAFSNGLSSLGQGVSQYASLKSSLGGMGGLTGGSGGGLNASSLLQSGVNPQNAQAASYIAKSAPGQLQSLSSTLSSAVQYATSHGISVPSIATSALQGAR